MKNPTDKKTVRKTPRSTNAARVDRQLEALKTAAPKKGATVLNFEDVSGQHVKAALTEAKAKSKPADVKKAIAKLRETAPKIPRHVQGAKPSKAVLPSQSAKPTSEVTRGMLGKVRRAHRKAGIDAPTEAQLETFAVSLLKAGVAIMKLTSSRIAKAVKGEVEIGSLK